MNIGKYKLLLFPPQGKLYVYEGNTLPDTHHIPVGTYAYDMAGYFGESGWLILEEYTSPRSVGWNLMGLDDSQLIHITKEMKMMTLVMT